MNPLRALTFLLTLLLLTAVTRPSPAATPGGVSNTTIKLPQGHAGVKGLGESFEPNPFTGTASYQVGIELPPGPISPSVALVYQGGKGRGEAGQSWHLPVLNIYRMTDKGLPEFKESDRFAVTGGELNDELVQVNAAARVYRLKNDDGKALFIRDSSNNTWTLRLPDGTQLFLGSSPASRQSNARGTYRWFIAEKRTLANRRVVYEYWRHSAGNHLYLSRIRYAFRWNASQGQESDNDHLNEVLFDYEERKDRETVFSDRYTDFTYGAREAISYRLGRIVVRHNAAQVGWSVFKTYKLNYRAEEMLSLLTSIEVTGEHGEPMPTLQFDYAKYGFNARDVFRMYNPPPTAGIEYGRSVFEDVNGDALPDLLVGDAGQYVYYENVDGFRWAGPTKLIHSPWRDLGADDVQLMDMDGDGFRDVVYEDRGARALRYHPGGCIQRGILLGCPGDPRSISLGDTAWPSVLDRRQMLDLNGDGRTDAMVQYHNEHYYEFLNRKQSGNGAELIDFRNEGNTLPDGVDLSDTRYTLADMNGDGLPDLVYQDFYMDPPVFRVWYGMGRGQYTRMWEDFDYVPRGWYPEMHLVDVNRDGMADLVNVSSAWVGVYWNRGNGTFSGLRVDQAGTPERWDQLVFQDMNGNGSVDVVWVSDTITYLDLVKGTFAGLLSRIDNGLGKATTIDYATSTSFAVRAKATNDRWRTTLPIVVPVVSQIKVTDSFEKLGLPANVMTRKYEYRDGYYDGKEREFRGFAEVKITDSGDEAQETQVTRAWMHVGRNLDTGADEEVLKGKVYKQTVESVKGETYGTVETKWERRWLCQEALELETPALSGQRILPSCTRFTTDKARSENKDSLMAIAVQVAGLSGTWEKTTNPRYTYEENLYNAWGDVVEHRVHGEVRRLQNSTVGNFGTFQEVLGDERIERTKRIYAVAPWLLGLSESSEVLDGNGVRVAAQRNHYDGPDYVGLPVGQVDKGYLTRAEVWLDRKDHLVSPGAAVDDQLGGSWLTTQSMRLDAQGHVLETRDAKGNRATLQYDDVLHALPTAESIWLGAGADGQDLWATTTVQYNLAYGVMTEATDANQKTTRYAYDNLGRLISVTDPLGSVVSSYGYTFGSPVTRVKVDTLLDRTAGTYQSSVEFIDGLGRTRLTKGQAEEGKILGGGWQTLTPRGNAKASYDSFVAFRALHEFEPAPGNAPVTRSTYDILGRPLSVTPPAVGGTTLPTRMLYPRPWETRSFDERDAQEQSESYPAISQVDGLGRVSRIIKYNDLGDGNPTPLVWGVGYDTLGNIRWITDPAYDLDAGSNPAQHCREDATNANPHVRCYWYNSLKQMIRLQDPHIGQVAYYYDALGNLAKRVDALGQEQLFDYGPANRLATVRAAHDASNKADYRYDFHYDETGPRNAGATNLVGRVSWIDWPHGVDAFSYDDLGRNHRSIAALWNPSTSTEDDQQRDVFAKDLSFDATGKVIAESLPGGLQLGYQYNVRGLLNTVTARFDGKPASVLASNLQYDHHGAMTRAQLGNGNGVCAWYDARGRRTEYKAGRLSETLTLESLCGAQGRDPDPDKKDPSVFLHNRYTHGFDGLIDKIEDLTDRRADIPRADAAFKYDRLYELTRAQVGDWTYRYRYDKLQNLISQQTDLLNDRIVKAIGDEPFEYGTNGAGPNQLTKAGEKTFTYNALGNMTEYNGFALDFDVEGRLVEASKPGGKTIRFLYDSAGERRLKITTEPGKPDKVFRYPLGDSYQLRDGQETWFVGAGPSTVEIAKAQGVAVTLEMLNELTSYVTDPERTRPLPAEYMDLNGDGVELNQADVDAAVQAYATQQKLGGERLVTKYTHADHLGGTTHVTDSAGHVVSVRQYHPYGVTVVQRGEKSVHGYAGIEEDDELEELGLVRMGARWYAPGVGRWISADPLFAAVPAKVVGGVLQGNLYGYVSNNPIMAVDPTGLEEGEPSTFFGWLVVEAVGLVFGNNTANAPSSADVKYGRVEKSSEGSREYEAAVLMALTPLPRSTGSALKYLERKLGPVARAQIGKLAERFGVNFAANISRKLVRIEAVRLSLISSLRAMEKDAGLGRAGALRDAVRKAANSLERNLKSDDLTGAVSELRNVPMANGGSFNHVQEVDQALGSLRHAVGELDKKIQHEVTYGIPKAADQDAARQMAEGLRTQRQALVDHIDAVERVIAEQKGE